MREPRVPEGVLKGIRAPFLEGSPTPIDPPVIQPLAEMLDLSGESKREALFVVQGDAGAEACLRPDFTIPVVLEHLAQGGPARRYYYEGTAFRIPPPGRPAEFLQIGVEDFTGVTDAAIAGLAWRASLAGGRSDLSIRVGDVGLFRAFLADIGTPEAIAARLRRAFTRPHRLKAELVRASTPNAGAAKIAAILGGGSLETAAAAITQRWAKDGLEPVGGRTAQEIAQRLADLAEESRSPCLAPAQRGQIEAYLAIVGGPDQVRSAVSALVKGEATDRELNDAGSMLNDLGKQGVADERIQFEARFGGPFTYYDGFVFQITSAALGSERTVAAGGRYDALLSQLSGRKAAAAGCMVRPYRAWKDAPR